jgi:undecaprenyl phosphate N,N'-diacetylbacillosamine 1-phosphate transferase
MYVKYFKRIFDILIGLFLVIVTFPLFLVIVVALFLFQGNVFFLQKRPGLHGQLFTVFKFRTMIDQKDKTGELLRDEQRITTIGKFLRRTNLDELPQLYNVLLGSMSLIGPRPFLSEYLELYSQDQIKRHYVRPGITGWAQVNGGNNISWKEKINFDLEYIEKVSFGFDLKILLITAAKILTLKGFDTGTFIPEKFKGE